MFHCLSGSWLLVSQQMLCCSIQESRSCNIRVKSMSWCHMPCWPVPVFSMLCYTVNSLRVPCFLHASMMYVQWSTLVNYAFPLIICTWQLYSLPAPGLDPGENKAYVSATAQFVPWAKMATVPDFQTGMMSDTIIQEAVEHAATHKAEEKAKQTTHHDDVSLRLHLGDVLSHATVYYTVLHCTCALTVPLVSQQMLGCSIQVSSSYYILVKSMLWCHMPCRPVPVFSMLCYTVTSLGVPCFL